MSRELVKFMDAVPPPPSQGQHPDSWGAEVGWMGGRKDGDGWEVGDREEGG